MRKLLRTDFARLKSCKTFWITLAVMLALCLYLLGDLCYRTVYYPERVARFENDFFNYTPFLGFCCAMMVCMFTGADYSDGTIRNKLIVGCERRDIYLSHLIAGFAMGAAVVVVSVAPMLAIGLPMSNGFSIPNGRAAALILLSVLATMAFTSICTALAMGMQNRTAAVIVAFAVMIALFCGALIGRIKLNQSETTAPYVITADGLVQEEEQPNPYYIGGVKREIYQWLQDIQPYGQIVQTADGAEPEHMERWPFTSALVILVSSGIGYSIFKRKDIK